MGIVLIIDDDEDDRDLFCIAVHEIEPRINCIMARNGEEALQGLRLEYPKPHIIFLDLNMPRINGIQCLRELKKDRELQDIPVVIYTASNLDEDKEEIKKAVATHAARCAEKLRKQNCCTGCIEVFLQTNQHRKEDRQYSKHVKIALPNAANSTNLLIWYAMKGVDMLYREGYNFHKAGVMVTKIVPQSQVQLGFWQQENREKNKVVIKALDSVNKNMGRDTLRFAAQGYSKGWKLRTDYISKCYTTRIEDILEVKD